MTLDPVIHQQHRLQMMAALYRNRHMSFVELRDAFGLTTGNAGSHLRRLEDAGYIKSGRLLRELSFELHYRITALGVRAFQEYIRELRTLTGDWEAGNRG